MEIEPNMRKEELKSQYHKEAERLRSEVNALKGRGRGFVIGEISSFLGMIFFIVLITLSDTTAEKTVEGILAVAMFAFYVFIRNKDVKNSECIADRERLYKTFHNEEKALEGDFSAFDDGNRYVDSKHPFTYDLDVFGKESLYQRMNRTVTTGGADRLAYYLSSVNAHESLDEINEYAGAIHLLSEDTNCNQKLQTSTFKLQPLTLWRMHFMSCGVDEKIDTDAILNSLPKLKKLPIPDYFGGKSLKVLIWILILGLIASIVAAVYGFVNPMLPIAWIFVNFFVVQGMANKYLKEMLTLGNKLHGQMQPLMKLIKHVTGGLKTSNSDCESDVLNKVKTKLESAVGSFDGLTNIVETLVLRGNDAYRFFADAFGLRGLFLVSKFYKWRNMASDNLPQWIDAIVEIDALVSMAQFSCDHQHETTNAKIIGGDEVAFEAKGLYHPFLGEKAVRNDFSIVDHNFYIITGANMAGKSTFLRAIGVNYILAMNGIPVFADNLKVTRFKLFTSMRTSDDLAHGISYFNAELLRLKQLIDSLDENSNHKPQTSNLKPQTLIILDEILKGTNSLDKLNGSRMFLRAMENKPVAGVVATHDLELSKMEQENSRFHNYCFEIELGTDVTYSYKITPGVARNQNATFLLKRMLEAEDK